MIIEIMCENKVHNIDVTPELIFKSRGTLYEFPHLDFNEDYQPICHTISVVVSMESIELECKLTDEGEKHIKTRYHFDDQEDQIVIARLEITEFPNEWKVEMDTSWFYWLDALDGDHAVIGNRADEIVHDDLYENAFQGGSLYYLERLDVHPDFRGNKLGLKLIQHTFKYMLRNANGIVLLIAKPMKSALSKDTGTFKNSSRLSNYYKRCGFKRIKSKSRSSILMEARIEDLILNC